jgi:23S rRNA (cytosine1962-C5)-methyltransferase
MNSQLNNQPKILSTKPSPGYELLDSGNGEKLERFGDFVLRRPDPQALWNKNLSSADWDRAHVVYINSGKSGSWRVSGDLLPESWPITIEGLSFGISLSAFKHVGIFPEHAENWNWIMETVGREVKSRPVTVLNLFGYTGGATLAAAKAGASVVHVDGSKVSVSKASENAKLSGLEEKPIRWIVDDAMEFVKREVRRGNKYDAIIMDPPAYGHGPNKELWEIETHLPELIAECQKILSDKPLFVLLNGYASGYSSIAYKNNILDLIGSRMFSENGGAESEIEFGELASETKDGRMLPAGIFARWRAGV